MKAKGGPCPYESLKLYYEMYECGSMHDKFMILRMYMYYVLWNFMLDVLVCIRVSMEKNLCICLHLVAYDDFMSMT